MSGVPNSGGEPRARPSAVQENSKGSDCSLFIRRLTQLYLHTDGSFPSSLESDIAGTAVGWVHRAVIGLPRIRFDQMHPSQHSLVLVVSTGCQVGSGDKAVLAYQKKFQKMRGLGN